MKTTIFIAIAALVLGATAAPTEASPELERRSYDCTAGGVSCSSLSKCAGGSIYLDCSASRVSDHFRTPLVLVSLIDLL